VDVVRRSQPQAGRARVEAAETGGGGPTAADGDGGVGVGAGANAYGGHAGHAVRDRVQEERDARRRRQILRAEDRHGTPVRPQDAQAVRRRCGRRPRTHRRRRGRRRSPAPPRSPRRGRPRRRSPSSTSPRRQPRATADVPDLVGRADHRFPEQRDRRQRAASRSRRARCRQAGQETFQAGQVQDAVHRRLVRVQGEQAAVAVRQSSVQLVRSRVLHVVIAKTVQRVHGLRQRKYTYSMTFNIISIE